MVPGYSHHTEIAPWVGPSCGGTGREKKAGHWSGARPKSTRRLLGGYSRRQWRNWFYARRPP